MAAAGGVDFEEIFAGGGAGGGFSDFFESCSVAARGWLRRRRRGRSRAAIPAPSSRCSLESVYEGGSARIGVDGKTLDVRIPKGIKPGQVIRLGGQGARCGGDLLLEIEYAAHPQFEVDGRNIIYVLPVAPWEAALGRNGQRADAGRPGRTEDSADFGKPAASCACAAAACPE